MADTASSPSASSFNLSAYKETAQLLLTLAVPPAAIAVRQGKDDLESRHLALSLALYLSVICYLPAVVHAYWLLYVRDNGGVTEWSGARLKQAEGLWNEHGGVAKAKVDEIAPKVRERFERARTYTTDKVKYAKDKKNEAVAYVSDTITAVNELHDDARKAYAEGTVVDWTKEKMRVVDNKVKALLEPYPRVKTIVEFVEQRVLGVLDMLGKIYETIRAKLQADEDEGKGATGRGKPSAIPRPNRDVVNDEVTGSTADSSKSSSITEDTAEEDASMDESAAEGRTEGAKNN